MLAVVLDQATVAQLPPRTSTLIVGNPMIADVTMLKTGAAMVVTAKGYGQTNIIALDEEGSVLLDEQLLVLPAKTVVVLQNGTSHVSYSCHPIACQPRSLATIQKASTTRGAKLPAATASRSAVRAGPNNFRLALARRPAVSLERHRWLALRSRSAASPWRASPTRDPV